MEVPTYLGTSLPTVSLLYPTRLPAVPYRLPTVPRCHGLVTSNKLPCCQRVHALKLPWCQRVPRLKVTSLSVNKVTSLSVNKVTSEIKLPLE